MTQNGKIGGFELNKVYCMDCFKMLNDIPDKSIDLVLIDPPYFQVMLTDWKGEKHSWDNQWKNIGEYQDWILCLGQEIKRILKDNGSFYIFADDKICAYVQVTLDQLFQLVNSITWVKPNNLTIKGWSEYRCYAPITEKILFYSNEWDINSGKLIYDKIMIENIAPRNNFAQYLKAEFERAKNNGINVRKIIVNELKMDTAMLNRWTEGFGSIIKEEHYLKLRELLNYEYLKKDYEDLRRPFNPTHNFTDVWTFNIMGGKESFGQHPTQKPINIIKRIIKTSSKEGDIILDCFMGTGTTARACKELYRNFIGCDNNQEYVNLSNQRLQQEVLIL